MPQRRMGPATGNRTQQRPLGRHKTSWVETWADIREGFNLTIRPLFLHAVGLPAQTPPHFYQKELPTSGWTPVGMQEGRLSPRGVCPDINRAQSVTNTTWLQIWVLQFHTPIHQLM